MTSPISGISAALSGIQGLGAAAAPAGHTSASPTSGTDFASVLTGAVDELNNTQATADSLAAQAATGDLDDVHDYMIAANEAKLATDMVVTIKNKAVEAFNEIMRMPV